MQSARAVDTLHRGLLTPTILEGHTVPFYRNLWRGSDLSGVQEDPVGTLVGLPSFTKAAYRQSDQAVVREDRSAAVVVHSTGTSGRPLLRYRCSEEIEAFRDFVQRRTGEPEVTHVTFSALAGFVHGGRSPLRPDDITLEINTGSPVALQRAIDLLTRTDLLPGSPASTVRTLVVTPDALALLTAALSQTPGGPAAARIDTIVNLTDTLPRPSRDFVERVWAPTRIVNRFSLSEIFGGATVSAEGRLSFDPSVYVEVLSLTDDSAVEQGIGELTLTELYPFSQIQPFIRYRTGDLVERTGEGVDGVLRLVGRRSMVPALPSAPDRPLLNMVALRSRLDAEALLARDELAPWLPAARGLGGVLGQWSVSSDPAVLRLTLAPVFNPQLFAELSAKVLDRLHAIVCEEMAAMGHREGDGIALEVAWSGERTSLPMLGSRPGVWTDQADTSPDVTAGEAR